MPNCFRQNLALFASVSRLHIVAIAALGTFTFGWLFTGRHLPQLAAITAFDWFLVNLLNRVVDLPEDRQEQRLFRIVKEVECAFRNANGACQIFYIGAAQTVRAE